MKTMATCINTLTHKYSSHSKMLGLEGDLEINSFTHNMKSDLGAVKQSTLLIHHWVCYARTEDVTQK